MILPAPNTPELATWKLESSRILDKSQYAVFVLGAGASKDAGMPICRDFFDAEFIGTVKNHLSKESMDFYEKFNDCAGIEQLLVSFIEEERDEDVSALLRFYEEVFVAAETVGGGVDAIDESYFDNFAYYLLFVMQIRALGEAGIYPVIISFNHDIWVERAVQLLTLNKSGFGYNYGRISDRLFATKNAFPSFPSFDYSFTLLKMHGSFNWLCCCSCKHIFCLEEFLWSHAGVNCRRCGQGKMEPMYIPPHRNKDYSPLAELWSDAVHVLERAHWLMTVGYSLPHYDFEAKELLRSLNRQSSLFLLDKFASSVAGNYSEVPANQKFALSRGFREFIEGGFRFDEFEPF